MITSNTEKVDATGKLRYLEVEKDEERTNEDGLPDEDAHWGEDGIGCSLTKNGQVEPEIRSKVWSKDVPEMSLT